MNIELGIGIEQKQGGAINEAFTTWPASWTGSNWAVVGGAAYNTPLAGAELLTNGGCETFTGGVANSWTASGGGTPAEEAVIIYTDGGAKSQLITGSGVIGTVYQYVTTVIGQFYQGVVYGYNGVGTNGAITTRSSTGSDLYRTYTPPSGSWGQSLAIFRAATVSTGFREQVTTNLNTVYMDGASLKKLYWPALVSFPIPVTGYPYIEAVWSAQTAYTAWGLLVNCDTNFAAQTVNAEAVGATSIELKNVTKAITTSDLLLDKINNIQYTISSVGTLSVGLQTVTLAGGGLSAEIAAGVEVGIDYASWNGLLIYATGGGNAACWKRVGTNWTQLGTTTAITYGAAKALKVSAYSGTDVICYYDTTALFGGTLTKEAVHTGARYNGVFSTHTGNQITSLLIR